MLREGDRAQCRGFEGCSQGPLPQPSLIFRMMATATAGRSAGSLRRARTERSRDLSLPVAWAADCERTRLYPPGATEGTPGCVTIESDRTSQVFGKRALEEAGLHQLSLTTPHPRGLPARSEWVCICSLRPQYTASCRPPLCAGPPATRHTWGRCSVFTASPWGVSHPRRRVKCLGQPPAQRARLVTFQFPRTATQARHDHTCATFEL